MKTKKAQAGPIIGLLFAFVLVAFFSIILAPLYSFIEVGVNATAGETNGTIMAMILNSIPVFAGLILLIVIILLIMGRG